MTKAYLDDIIVGGADETECKANLIRVMERLQEYNVKVNGDKCVWLKNRVTYLGHILGDGKITVHPTKLDAIVNAPAPTNIEELQSYIGLLNFLRKFVPNVGAKGTDGEEYPVYYAS